MDKTFKKVQTIVDNKILLSSTPGWIYDLLTKWWWMLYYYLIVVFDKFKLHGRV